MLEICDKMRRKFDELMLAYHSNPSNLLFAKVKDKYDALNSLVSIIEEKCLKQAHVKHEDKPWENSSIRDIPLFYQMSY
jgi:hypothetical protein